MIRNSLWVSADSLLYPRGSLMRQALLRNLVVIFGVVAWLGGCGGGGEQRKPPDASTDGAVDKAPGDAAYDGGADTPVDRPGDAGIEAPGKPLGNACTTGGECLSGFCAD